MKQLSLVFKALSEPIRLEIIKLLLIKGKEAYGDELAKSLGIPAYRLSRHLKVLKSTGLVAERRAGRWVYYSLPHANGQLSALRELIARAQLEGSVAPSQPDAAETREPTAEGHPQAPVEEGAFNWNQGPAVPGVL